MNYIEQICENIAKGNLGDVKKLIRGALKTRINPQEVLEKGLIAAMAVVGDKFKNHEVYIPEVILSAKAMKAGLEELKPFLVPGKAKRREIVILGTVRGDLHDIGKNLVGMMLEGAGYEVYDLGVDVEVEKFMSSAKMMKARLIALSALLTTTMPSMKDVIDALEEAGLKKTVKVMVGGAPLTDKFAREIGADGYAPDAAAAVDKAKELLYG